MAIPDESFYDDSSESLNLGHGLSALRAREELDRKRIERDLHKRGITDLSQVVPRNAGAYTDVESRTRELQTSGMSLADATAQALSESPEPKPIPEVKDYLGASIQSLMHQPNLAPGSGGSKKGRARSNVRPLTGQERMDRRVLGAGAYDEGSSAGVHPGRPRDGVEVKVVRRVRVEPRDVDTIRASGTTEAKILPEIARCMRLARSGAERDMIVETLLDLVGYSSVTQAMAANDIEEILDAN